jgi:hypothetical protein
VTLYKFLLTQPGRVIVFVNHVSSVRALTAMLQVELLRGCLQSCLLLRVYQIYISFSCSMYLHALCTQDCSSASASSIWISSPRAKPVCSWRQTSLPAASISHMFARCVCLQTPASTPTLRPITRHLRLR